MPNFNLQKEIDSNTSRLESREATLGKGLMQPFRHTNSSGRAIMWGTQREQIMEISSPEVPIISTGYEIRYGEASSNFVKSDRNYTVVAKIPKYPNDRSDMRKYMIVLLDSTNNTLRCIERSGYMHVSESYGYTYNNLNIDHLQVGDMVPKGMVIRKSSSFDEYNNRQDGVNLTTAYIASGFTTEDPIVISESAAKKFTSPLFETVSIVVNDNDILLNLYGADGTDEYKAFPNIGEEVRERILCAVRREKKDEEALFAQSWDNLKQIMISDEKYIVGGTVVDIDICCNNPETLEETAYNQQFLQYYNANKDYSKRIVDCIKPLVDAGIKMEYETAEFYSRCVDVVNNVQYINDKVFNNIILKITVMRMIPLIKGDKITDRYGGKGVISKVLPDELMPKRLNTQGVWEAVDVQYNSSTCVNRENPGQLFETAITFVGSQVVEYIYTHNVSFKNAEEMIYTFLSIVSPNEAEDFREECGNLTDDDRTIFIRSIISDGNIYCVIKPMTDKFTLKRLAMLYEAFPFVKQSPIMTVMRDSNGNLRNVIARRVLTVGSKYIFRLKQFAEEKFSVVSLASTNIRGENSKSKSSKQHKSLYSATPVRFGEMEWEDLIHIKAVEQVITVLMLLSSSPGARKLNQQLLTGNPFNIDIKLDESSTSRSVEIAMAYLKTLGLKIQIEKVPKKVNRGYRIVATRIPGRNIPKEAAIRIPFKDIDSEVDKLVKAAIENGDITKDAVVRIDKDVDATEENAKQIILDKVKSRMIKLASLYKEEYGAKTVDEVCNLMKDKSVKVAKTRIRVASRLVAMRIPDNGAGESSK